MTLADVNILVNAFRADSEHHRRCADWLDSVVNGDSAYGVSPQVLCSFLRVVTHPKIFVRPSKREEAAEFAMILITQPHCHLVNPGSRHWDIFTHLCKTVDAKGNLIQDAWFAAIAIEAGCDWITLDRHFSGFPGLRWRGPQEE